MNESKKYDFLAALVKNPDLTIADLKESDITPANSTLLPKDDYKNIPGVISEFSDESGKFDEKRFDTYYDNARVLYADYANDELVGNIVSNLTYGPDAWFAPEDAVYRNDKPIIAINKTPATDSQGIKYITELYSNSQNLSIRERAQREKVVDFETGEELDYSPNDKAGLFKRFALPTLVLAQYDENGTHLQDGIEVSHQAGDLKLNENGQPYYETLGNREIYNKDVLRNSDILTVDGSKWNKLDFFDSDDTKKSAGKVALNLIADVAPMFIPGVGEIYGYLGAAAGIARVMPVLGKTINGILTHNNNNNVGKFFSDWEAYAARFDQTSSDYGRDNAVSLEGLGNLVSDISRQLFEQRAISTIPVLVQRARGVKNVESAVNWSKNLPLAYMAATSAQDVYGDFKQAGASDAVAGLGMLASTLALYRLMNIDYFRDNILKDTFMDESEVRAALRGVSKDVVSKFKPDVAIADSKAAASFAKKFSDFYHDTLLSGLRKKGVAGLVNRGFSEGTEEVMEEVATDLVKATTEALNALGIPVTEREKQLDFGWSGQDFATRYGMSFAGGFLGGMIFAGQNAYEKWLNSTINNIPKLSQSDMQKLVYYIANGKRSEIDDYLNKWHDKGLLGSKDLSVDGDVLNTLDGTERFIPKTTGISQNDAVYQTIKNELDTLEQAIMSEVPDMRYLTKEGLDNLHTIGYSDADIYKNPQLLTASTIAALGDYSSFENDLYKTLTDIATTKVELQNRVKELSKPATTQDERKTQAQNIQEDAKIKELQEKLANLRLEKENFFNGNKNKYYSGQALFAANSGLHDNFVNISKENYVKLKYERSYESFNDEQRKKIDDEYALYTNTEGRNNIYRAYDLYLNLSEKYAPIIQEYGNTLDASFDENSKTPKILGINGYLEAREKEQKLQGRLNELSEIDPNERTEEQNNEMEEISGQLSAISKLYGLLLTNPQLANISPVKDSAINGFANSVGENQRISIYDDLTGAMTGSTTNLSIPAIQILNSLRTQYSEDAKTGKFRFDDGELNAFLKGLAASYIAAGGARSKVNLFKADILQGKYVDEEGTIPEIESAVELDINNPIWTADRVLDNNVVRIIDDIVKNLGTNNLVAINAYNELLEILKNTTRLLEPENEEYLKDFLNSVIPTVGGESIIDIIQEFDDYRSKINYSAFLSIAEKLGTDVKDLNLLKLIEQEFLNLSTSSRLDEYLIQDNARLSSINSKGLDAIFNVVKAVVTGAADGTNVTINNFKEGDIPELATMSENAARHILQQANEFQSRIDFLRQLSEINNARSLRKHKDTAVVMTPKWLRSILDLKDSIKDTFKIDVEELWKTVSGNIEIPDVTADNFDSFNANVIEFYQKLYEEFNTRYPNKSDKAETKKLAEDLLSLVNAETLYKCKSTKITDNKDNEIEPIDIIYNLATIISCPAKSFYEAWLATEDNSLAPVPGQEYATKQIIGQILNPSLYNALLDGIQDKANYSSIDNKDVVNYLKNKTRLYNLAVVLGSAGSGKTIGVIKRVLTNLGDPSNYQFVFIAKEIEQAEKLRNAAGFDGNAYTVNELCNTQFGEPISKYSLNENSHVVSASEINSVGTVFDQNKTLKITVVDEIETLTEAELARLSADANDNNTFIIGLGDIKQPGTDVPVKNKSNENVMHSSGIEDCAYVSTPVLTTSMRPQTLAKAENTALLSTALDHVIDIVQEKPETTLETRDNLVKETLAKKNTLYYYENKNTGELSGDMAVSSNEELIQKLQAFSQFDDETLIIADDDKIGTYSKYQSDKVKVIPYSKRAGVEADYVIVDVDFKKHDSRGSSISPYLLAQDFYTLTQRSRKGTVIKTIPEINNIFNFTSDENKNQTIKVTLNQIKDFGTWWVKSLSNIAPDATALKKLIDESPLVVGYMGETPHTQTIVEKANPVKQEHAPVETTPSGTVKKPNTSLVAEENNVSPDTTAETPATVNPDTQVEHQQAQIPTQEPFSRERVDYFNVGDSEFTSVPEFINILAASFPDVFREINSINKTTLPKLDEFVHGDSKELKSIKNSVQFKYGDKGLNLLNNLLENCHGYQEDQGSKIRTALKNLRPIITNISDNGRPRGSLMDGDVITTNDVLFDLISSKDFLDWSNNSKDTLDSFHDVRKVVKNVTVNNNKDFYRIVNTISSSVRTGLFNKSTLSKLSGNINMISGRDLSRFINGDTSMWIIPYKNKLGLLVSRHYSKDGSQMFDIPVLVLENPGMFGKYVGTIDLLAQLQLGHQENDIHIPISQMQANYPNLRIDTISGIVNVPGKSGNNYVKIPDVNKPTEQFLNSQNGKVFKAVTDEVSIADTYFDANRSIYHTDTVSGNSILQYGKYAYMGIQCGVSIETFFNLLNKYRQVAGLTEQLDAYKPKQFGNNTSEWESMATASSFVIEDINFIKNTKGQIRQLLPLERAGELLTTAVLCSENAAFNLTGIMKIISDRDGKYKKTYTLQIGPNLQIGIINDAYEVVTYDTQSGELVKNPNYNINVSAKGEIKLAEILEKLGIDEIVPIHLVYHSFNVKNKTDFSRSVSTNWELSYVLNGTNENDKIAIANNLKEHWGHGIYLDDAAEMNSKSADSYYSLLNTGNREYYTDDNIVTQYSKYVVNINPQDVIPFEQTNKQTFAEFLNENKLPFANSVEEFNTISMMKSRNGQFKVVEETDDGYLVRDSDNNDFAEWVFNVFSINIDSNISRNGYTHGLIINNDVISFGDAKEIMFTSPFTNITAVDYTKAVSDADDLYTLTEDVFDTIYYDTIERYIASKFFNNITYDQLSVINMIKENLEFAQKIAIFEEDFNC